MNQALKDIVIIYHGQCRDGFGSAYSAWKKFGHNASYLPVRDHGEAPEGLKDKEIYILDFCFNDSIQETLIADNKSVVVIDHHKSVREIVEKFSQNVFDNDHSGAVLSWKYFHPETKVPPLLEYIEDHDIWKFELPNNREYAAALGEYPVTFEDWDKLITNLEDEEFLSGYLEKGALLSKFSDDLVESLMKFKERVLFEGHEVWALNVSRTYRSILGHKLAILNKEAGETALGIVYYHSGGTVNISLRSEGDVDVSKMAQKYGGGGHQNSAGIEVASFNDLPFTFIKD